MRVIVLVSWISDANSFSAGDLTLWSSPCIGHISSLPTTLHALCVLCSFCSWILPKRQSHWRVEAQSIWRVNHVSWHCRGRPQCRPRCDTCHPHPRHRAPRPHGDEIFDYVSRQNTAFEAENERCCFPCIMTHFFCIFVVCGKLGVGWSLSVVKCHATCRIPLPPSTSITWRRDTWLCCPTKYHAGSWKWAMLSFRYHKSFFSVFFAACGKLMWGITWLNAMKCHVTCRIPSPRQTSATWRQDIWLCLPTKYRVRAPLQVLTNLDFCTPANIRHTEARRRHNGELFFLLQKY